MQNICETSSTGYVEHIHNKLRTLEKQCDTLEPFQPVPSPDKPASPKMNAAPPASTMRVRVQNNSQHLLKLAMKNVLPTPTVTAS